MPKNNSLGAYITFANKIYYAEYQMSWGKEITLSGEYAALEPLSLEHDDALQIAVADGELWQLWYTHIPQPQDMRAEIAHRLDLREQGTMLPFAIRRQDTGAICGMTTYMHIDAANRRL